MPSTPKTTATPPWPNTTEIYAPLLYALAKQALTLPWYLFPYQGVSDSLRVFNLRLCSLLQQQHAVPERCQQHPAVELGLLDCQQSTEA